MRHEKTQEDKGIEEIKGIEAMKAAVGIKAEMIAGIGGVSQITSIPVIS